MQPFSFSSNTLRPESCREALCDPAAGGYASFEGWVRDHNDGRRVRRLEYEAFEALAIKEGSRIVQQAIEKFGVSRAACVHRVGDLAVGELAVWVGVSAAHRQEAFAACRYIIDEVKHRVPIWKKEHYEDGDSGWVNCERCAEVAVDHVHDGGMPHAHDEHQDTATTGFAHDYSRQVALPEVGQAGQQRIRNASVLVIGAGGLGVPALQYLAAAGVGRIGILDGDVVEASNLHRQPLYGVADIGRPKAVAAADRLRSLNRDVRCDAIVSDATAGEHRRARRRLRRGARVHRQPAGEVPGKRCRRARRQARLFRERLPVRRTAAGLSPPARLAVPAVPVARSTSRRHGRQLRRGRCAGTSAGHARRDAGHAGAAGHPRSRAGAGTRARGRGSPESVHTQHPRGAARRLRSRCPRGARRPVARAARNVVCEPRRGARRRLRARGYPRGVGAAVRPARRSASNCTCP